MKKLLFLNVYLFSNLAFSFGESNYNTYRCIEMSLSASNIEKSSDVCYANLIEIKNNKKWRSVTKICPLEFKRKLVYVSSHGFLSTDDEVEITNKQKCFIKYVDGVHINTKPTDFSGYKIKEFPKGTVLKKLTDINFFKIRSKDLVWTYHLTPGISADVEITGEMCGKEICLDEKKQKISKVLNVYKDFIMMDDENKIYYSSAVDGK